jgi:hypothetical protein
VKLDLDNIEKKKKSFIKEKRHCSYTDTANIKESSDPVISQHPGIAGWINLQDFRLF